MTREEAAAALRTFVCECVDKKSTPGATKDEVLRRKEFEIKSRLDGIEYMLRHYIEGRKGADDRNCARRLEKAAERYLREVIRGEPIWSYMLFQAPERSLGLEQPPVKYYGREAWLPEHYDAVLSAGLVRSAANATAEALKRGKRQSDPRREALGLGLASVFSQLKGRPTYSKESTFEKPVGGFSRFVQLAILASPHAEHPRVTQIKKAFATFVKDAAERLAAEGTDRDKSQI